MLRSVVLPRPILTALFASSLSAQLTEHVSFATKSAFSRCSFEVYHSALDFFERVQPAVLPLVASWQSY